MSCVQGDVESDLQGEDCDSYEREVSAMTDMTGRCRRHHQNQCEGPTTKGLCAKHRATWEAMVEDWDTRARATEAATNPAPSPPLAVWLPKSGYTSDGAYHQVTEGWYVNHDQCCTTDGPHSRDVADQLIADHPVDCSPAKQVRGKHRNPRHGITHCLRGHEYTPANTVIKADGHRRCRTCQNLQSAKARAKKKTTTNQKETA